MYWSLIVFAWVVCVVGWGGDGHRIITSLATQIAHPDTVRFVKNFVGDDLAEASTWADSDDATVKYPESDAYHFSNTPYRKCAAFEMKRDCGFGKTKGICLVTGLTQAIKRASTFEVSEEVRADSLRFILHLMADIHQPLHTGFREDTGGLRIPLKNPEGSNLHFAWDSWLVEQLGPRLIAESKMAEKLFSGQFIDRMKNMTNSTDILSSDGNIFRFVASIATETSTTATCRVGYRYANGTWIGAFDSLDEEFVATRLPLMQVQMYKAAVRLGILLDGIRAQYVADRDLRKDEKRVERINKLFTMKIPVPSKSDFSGENFFEPLFIDFNPEESEWVPDFADRKPTVRDRGRRGDDATRTTDLELLDQAAAAGVAERESYIFLGVDVAQIVFTRIAGVPLVTTKMRARTLDKPPHTRIIPFTCGGSGILKKFVIEIDYILWKDDEIPDELFIRILLQISGIDPRIDITDYRKSFHRDIELRSYRVSKVQRRLALLYASRPRSSLPQGKQLTAVQSKIVQVPIDETLCVFVNRDTLKTFMEVPRIRFHRFYYSRDIPKSTTGYIYIDPAILDETPESVLTFTFLERAAKRNMDRFGLPNVPSIVRLREELSELHSALLVQELSADHREGPELKYVRKIYTYDGDEGHTYAVIEWFRKSKFTTEEEILKYLDETNP